MYMKLRGWFDTQIRTGQLQFQSKTAATQFFTAVMRQHASNTKLAAEATPSPQEAQAIGEALTEQDLKSFQKILALLYNMYSQYQMQGGAGGPGQAVANQAAAQGMAGAMPPDGGAGGMPMDPMMQGGGMPPQGMPMDPAMVQGGGMPKMGSLWSSPEDVQPPDAGGFTGGDAALLGTGAAGLGGAGGLAFYGSRMGEGRNLKDLHGMHKQEADAFRFAQKDKLKALQDEADAAYRRYKIVRRADTTGLAENAKHILKGQENIHLNTYDDILEKIRTTSTDSPAVRRAAETASKLDDAKHIAIPKTNKKIKLPGMGALIDMGEEQAASMRKWGGRAAKGLGGLGLASLAALPLYQMYKQTDGRREKLGAFNPIEADTTDKALAGSALASTGLGAGADFLENRMVRFNNSRQGQNEILREIGAIRGDLSGRESAFRDLRDELRNKSDRLYAQRDRLLQKGDTAAARQVEKEIQQTVRNMNSDIRYIRNERMYADHMTGELNKGSKMYQGMMDDAAHVNVGNKRVKIPGAGAFADLSEDAAHSARKGMGTAGKVLKGLGGLAAAGFVGKGLYDAFKGKKEGQARDVQDTTLDKAMAYAGGAGAIGGMSGEMIEDAYHRPLAAQRYKELTGVNRVGAPAEWVAQHSNMELPGGAKVKLPGTAAIAEADSVADLNKASRRAKNIPKYMKRTGLGLLGLLGAKKLYEGLTHKPGGES